MGGRLLDDRELVERARRGDADAYEGLVRRHQSSAGPSGVGVLLTQFRASVEEAALRKVVPDGSQLEEVSVSGQKGYWFEGSPHLLFLTTPRGDSSRTAPGWRATPSSGSRATSPSGSNRRCPGTRW